MDNLDLLKKAKLAQQNIATIEQKLESFKIDQRNSKQNRLSNFQTKIAELKDSLKDFKDLPLKMYSWNSKGNGWLVGYNNPDFKFTINDINNYNDILSVQINLTSYHRDLYITIKEENSIFEYTIHQEVYSLDQVEQWMNIANDRVWTEKGLNNITKIFRSTLDVTNYVQSFIFKVLDLEEIEERNNRIEEKTLLANYLNVSIDTLKKENDYVNYYGTKFDIPEKGKFKIVKKYQIDLWFKTHIAKNLGENLDIELAAKNSKIDLVEWQKLKNNLTVKSLGLIADNVINAENYAKEFEKKYGWNKYVEAIDGYYIINLNNLEGVS